VADAVIELRPFSKLTATSRVAERRYQAVKIEPFQGPLATSTFLGYHGLFACSRRHPLGQQARRSHYPSRPALYFLVDFLEFKEAKHGAQKRRGALGVLLHFDCQQYCLKFLDLNIKRPRGVP